MDVLPPNHYLFYLFIYLFNGIHGEAPPERGIFFRLQVYEREWIFVVFERVGKCVISVCKKAQKCLLMYFVAVTKSIKRSGFVIYSYFKDNTFAALTKGRKSLNWVCVRGTIRQ